MAPHHPATDDEPTPDGAPCAVCGTPATSTHDDEPRCDRHTPSFNDVTVDQLVDELTNHGPDNSQTIFPTAQAEALAHRVVKGHTRPQTADALDISVYTVDDRLKRGKQNIDAVTDAVRSLLTLDLVDPVDDLGLEVGLGPQPAEDGETAAQTESSEPATPDDDPTLTDVWGLATRLDSTEKILMDDDSGSVLLDNPTDDERAALHNLIDRISGLHVAFDTPRGNGRRQVVVRPVERDQDVDTIEDTEQTTGAVSEQTEPVDGDESATADDEADAYTCHYCGDEFVLNDDTPDLARTWNEDADHPACPLCLGDVAMGDEKDPLPQFRNEPDVDDTADESATESYADAVDQTVDLDDDQEDVETLTGIGPSKATDLRAAGYYAVEDVADARVADLIDGGVLGPKLANQAHSEAIDRLTAPDDTEDADDTEDGVEPTEDLPEPYATLTPEYSGHEHEKRRAIHAATQYIREHDGAKASQIKEHVYPQHPADYGSGESWWRGVVRPGLHQLDHVDTAGPHGHTWVVDDLDGGETDG